MSKVTFTVERLSGDGDYRADKRHIEAESIFDVPALYAQALADENGTDETMATILTNTRHGELSIMGDRRRWFLQQIRFQRCNSENYCYDPEEVFFIVTAD